LPNVLTIAICAVISGAESWDDIAAFGETHAGWLGSFLDLTPGGGGQRAWPARGAPPLGDHRPGGPPWLQAEHAWPELRAIGMVQTERRLAHHNTIGTRYYASSRPLSAAALGNTVRSHGRIEN
jgi:hypothetical protein